MIVIADSCFRYAWTTNHSETCAVLFSRPIESTRPLLEPTSSPTESAPSALLEMQRCRCTFVASFLVTSAQCTALCLRSKLEYHERERGIVFYLGIYLLLVLA